MKVCARLEADQLRCWIAPRDISAGRAWSEMIIDALDGARAMVAIISQESNASEQVLREITLAADRKLPIVPVVIDQSPLARSLQFFLATPHRLDAAAPPIEQHLPKLVEAVRRLVTARAAEPAKPKVASPKALKVALVTSAMPPPTSGSWASSSRA